MMRAVILLIFAAGLLTGCAPANTSDSAATSVPPVIKRATEAPGTALAQASATARAAESLPTGPAAQAATALGPTPVPTLKSVFPPTLVSAPTTVSAPTVAAKAVATALPTPVDAAALPKLNVLLQACDTGLDVFNQLGEVTNAYVVVQNPGDVAATQVHVVLSAEDEEKDHPDKSYLIQNLPPGYEIALKLTVDTASGVDSAVFATVTTAEGAAVQASKSSCRQRRPDKVILDALGELFSLRKMVTP